MARDFDFSGKTILVTGSASGIGAATCRWLVDHGAERLVLVDLKAREDANEGFGCSVDLFAGDVGDPSLWERLERQAPLLDHAVLNAGIASTSLIADTSFEQWRRVLATNLDGAFLSLRTALHKLRDGGSIVITASASAMKAEAGTGAYAASKAAVVQLAKVAAKEAAPRKIRVNAIAPGGVDTPIWDQVPFFRELVSQHQGNREEALAAMARVATPMGRFATANEIADQIGFLLSDRSQTVTGTVLVSDGGYSI